MDSRVRGNDAVIGSPVDIGPDGLSGALEDVISGLLDELPPGAFPGEDPARVLMAMIVGSVHPAASVAGVRDCRSAIALVVAIRERVLADLHTAAELSKERD